jgi:sec-independent protein translocase protein TatB
MEILGIGPSELLFIIILALIMLGPRDMQKAGKTVGRWLNNLVRSDGWKAFQQTSREIRSLPTKLMRDANLELAETEKDIRKVMEENTGRPASPKSRSLIQPQGTENSTQSVPPTAKPTEADTDPNEKNP